MVISLSNIVIQSKINAFGSAAMAGHSAASRVDAFVYMPMNAISLATTTFAAQNLGARRLDRVKQGTRTSILLGMGITIVVGWAASLVAEPLIKMFAEEQEVIDYGIMSLQIRCYTYFLFCLTDVLGGVIRGSGNAVVPMCISLTNMCVIRIIWLVIATSIWNDFSIVVITYPLTWTLTSLCYLVYYLKGNWMKKWEAEHSV
jgi:Na+-driven multidrug efflux pump